MMGNMSKMLENSPKTKKLVEAMMGGDSLETAFSTMIALYAGFLLAALVCHLIVSWGKDEAHGYADLLYSSGVSRVRVRSLRARNDPAGAVL